MFTSGASPHSVRQTLVFCTGRGYVDIPYSRGRFSVRDRVIWTFGTADPCFLYGTELRGHSVRQRPLFCTGRGYMDIRYGRPLFSVRDGVAVASVRYTVGPPV